MNNPARIAALIFGLLAIIFGAFGAHALQKVLTPAALSSFETGVRYQFYMAFFLLYLGLETKFSAKRSRIIFWLTLSGTILFSGSIYLLVLLPVVGLSFKMFGLLTPIGGTLLIAAWVVALLHFFSDRKN
jgi:uncharacterized membrane protein YgdD (TMEM256/DUF423 family)